MKRVKPKRGKGTARERVLARCPSAHATEIHNGWFRITTLLAVARTEQEAWAEAAARLERE